MRPLLSETQDSDKLQDLGRASIQIVHDLKNQLNGLKLYATFLRRRLEKGERPADEQETVAKIIAGLERAANDLSMIVQYGRPLHPQKQPRVDLQSVLQTVCATLNEPNTTGNHLGSISLDAEPAMCCGEYDPSLLADALRSISLGALKLSQYGSKKQALRVRIRKGTGVTPMAIIEWPGVNHSAHDPFRSFAGSHEIRMSLAAKIVEAHGGSAECMSDSLVVTLPLSA